MSSVRTRLLQEPPLEVSDCSKLYYKTTVRWRCCAEVVESICVYTYYTNNSAMQKCSRKRLSLYAFLLSLSMTWFLNQHNWEFSEVWQCLPKDDFIFSIQWFHSLSSILRTLQKVYSSSNVHKNICFYCYYKN